MKKEFVLNNGVRIPSIALGTWLMNKEEAYIASLAALDIGYRHIDTAVAYGNEEAVGRALIDTDVPREEIYITTKLPAEIKDATKARKEIEGMFKRLKVDYIDLVIIHCPQPWIHFRRNPRKYDKGNVEVYRVLEEYYKTGKIKSIGVSNFLKDDLENIINNCEVVPAVNQILAHVKNIDLETIKYCRERNILIEAYSPLGHGTRSVMKDKTIKAIADKYGVSVAQICLRFCLQLDMLVIPKTTNIDHMKSNFDLDFEISQEDMDRLISLAKIKNYGVDEFWPVFSKGK